MMLLWNICSVLCGASVGLTGVYVVGFRMPFIGVTIAHAAMAGAVFAYIFGLPQAPIALFMAIIAAAGVAWLTSRYTLADLNTVTSILLSLTMGLTFLGIGIHKGDMSPLLGLMWGSFLFVKTTDLYTMTILAFVLVLFSVLFRKELESILFSRTVSRVSGINDSHIMILMLILTAFIVTVYLQIIGGLMVYSLLTNPAASAFELGKNMKIVKFMSVGFGILSTLAGFWISYIFNLPTGACIVLVSGLIYFVSVILRKWFAEDWNKT